MDLVKDQVAVGDAGDEVTADLERLIKEAMAEPGVKEAWELHKVCSAFADTDSLDLQHFGTNATQSA